MIDFKDFIAEGEGKYKGEGWEAGFKRRVVKTTKPDHKEQGFNWRIKGKERPEVTIKLYKNKPDFVVLDGISDLALDTKSLEEILGDMGAEIVKIEPPGGDWMRNFALGGI